MVKKWNGVGEATAPCVKSKQPLTYVNVVQIRVELEDPSVCLIGKRRPNRGKETGMIEKQNKKGVVM